MHIIRYIKAVILIAAFFVSCETKYSSEELVNLSMVADSLSVEFAYNVNMRYTDSAVLRATISAPVMKRYSEQVEPYTEMPEGLVAKFYDVHGRLQSTMVANYAISYDDKDMVIIRDSVRVVNYRDEEIKTQELIWKKTERKIYSNKGVRIRERDEKIIIGEGFESNESFTKYSISKLTGTIYLQEDEQQQKD